MQVSIGEWQRVNDMRHDRCLYSEGSYRAYNKEGKEGPYGDDRDIIGVIYVLYSGEWGCCVLMGVDGCMGNVMEGV